MLKEVKLLNKELQSVEALRNKAMQSNQEDGKQNPEVQELNTKIEQLQERKMVGETKVGIFELQVAQENPEHARWLEEQIPPAKERKIDKETAIEMADMALGILPNDPSTSGLITKTTAHVLDYAEEMKDYTMGAIHKGIEGIKNTSEKDKAGEWEKELEKKEQAVNEKFDKEVKETEKSLQKQLDYIENKLDDGNEKLNKQNELKDTIDKVKEDIKKDRNTELEKLKIERAALEKIKETTKSMNEQDQQKAIQDQRKEFERQREIEKQR